MRLFRFHAIISPTPDCLADTFRKRVDPAPGPSRKHPDKTDMERIDKGFNFLGYHFSPQGLSLGEKTVENFLDKARRSHEQGSETSEKEELSDYVERWCSWAYGGLAPLPNGRECRSHRDATEGTKDIPHVPLRIQPSGFMSKGRSNDIWGGLEGGTREISAGVSERERVDGA
jgi:hypothetical protein